VELDSIPVFVKVAQLGSFTQASKALNMPNTTVSSKVAQLERHLGVTLIQRTTRKLHLTEAGRSYLERCVRALNELQAAESELHTNSNEIVGILKITSSVDIGQSLLAGMVDRYIKLHPKMEIELVVTNRVVDLVGEGVDLAIRAGKLKDSSLIAKKFIDVRFTLWASKSYLKKQGTPKDFKDLQNFTFIRFTPLKDENVEFTNGKQTVKVTTVRGPVQADDFGAVKALAELGQGIAMIPDFLCENDTSENRLVKVLPDWWAKGGNFALVYPAQQFVTPKVRAFITVAEEFFKNC
jgi:DNA-binding transcriptional LysR family regulator